MLSLRLARRHYDGYEANPSRTQKQQETLRSARSDEENLQHSRSNRPSQEDNHDKSNDSEKDDSDTEVGNDQTASDRDPAEGEQQQKEEIENKKKESDPHYVTWDSDDDPLNPQNWSYLKKWSILILVSGVTFIVTFSSSVFSADSKVVSELFGISAEVSELGTALYLVGFGVGPLAFGPMSEAFGRSPVYFGTFLAFLLCNLGPALGQNPQAVFISRFFTGKSTSCFVQRLSRHSY